VVGVGRVAGMKQVLLMIAVLAVVGCGESKKETSQKSESPKAAPEKLIADPIVEKAIRKEIKKPTGELTKADLEKVTGLNLGFNKLTEVPKGLEKLTQLKTLWLYANNLTDVKVLEKLTKLESLYLDDNPALTKAQIAQLQKALPKCEIRSNPKK